MQESREICFKCHRPETSCMCGHIRPIETRTKFVLLMHPKENRKTKNGTGRLTHLSLPNSEIHVGIDFSNHKRVNALIDDPENDCYILYPGENSIRLNDTSVVREGRRTVIFIIDSTWACSKKMLRLSKNLHPLPRVSFEHAELSRFKIKHQPKEYCLSTIESTRCVLELLAKHGDEQIEPRRLETFLAPFEAMVAYQVNRLETEHNVRFAERPMTPRRAARKQH